MRTTLYSLIDQLEPAQLPAPVVEFGAARAPGQEHRPAIRSRFPGRAFFAADLAPGAGLDHVEDLHHIGLRSGSVGTAIVLDTIEHVRRPWDALAEVRRILRPGGVVIMTSVFYFPIHAHPDDYWRFTASGFRSLLDGFDWVHAVAAGPRLVPHTVAAVAGRAPTDGCDTRLAAALDTWARHGATSWKERALMALPASVAAASYRLMARRGDR